MHYDCTSLRVLRDCRLDGSYQFAGVTPKEQVVQLRDASELSANLPRLGPELGVKLAADLERGTTFDLALIMVGRLRTTRLQAVRDDLAGKCAGATHFVRGATVGAFAASAGASAKVRTAAEVFGATGAASSTSQRVESMRDGSLDACRSASSGDPAPPKQCGAVLRVELVAIENQAAVRPANDPTLEQVACPRGTQFASGKCTASASTPHVCRPRDRVDCEAQCDRGSASSCTNLAFMFANGLGAPRDPARAKTLYERACDGGDVDGCASVAYERLFGASAAGDRTAATALANRACDGGSGYACSLLGSLYLSVGSGAAVAYDEARSASYQERGCKLGYAFSCSALGRHAEDGKGVPRDLTRAAQLYRRGCEVDDRACGDLARLYREGRGVPRDEAMAARLEKKRQSVHAKDASAFEPACEAGDFESCAAAASRYDAAHDYTRARTLYERACDQGRLAWACTSLSDLHLDGRGVPKDPRRWFEFQQKACEIDSTRYGRTLGVVACENVAWGYERGVGVAVDRAKAASMILPETAVVLAKRYAKGDDELALDMTRAAELFQRACDDANKDAPGVAEGCAHLGDLKLRGTGVAADRAGGLQLLRRACAAKLELACGRLREEGATP